jgi:hypothetical protein
MRVVGVMAEKFREYIEYLIGGTWVSGFLPVNRRQQDRRLGERRQGGERRDPLGRDERRKQTR